jgi:hypothetical protein
MTSRVHVDFIPLLLLPLPILPPSSPIHSLYFYGSSLQICSLAVAKVLMHVTTLGVHYCLPLHRWPSSHLSLSPEEIEDSTSINHQAFAQKPSIV